MSENVTRVSKFHFDIPPGISVIFWSCSYEAVGQRALIFGGFWARALSSSERSGTGIEDGIVIEVFELYFLSASSDTPATYV